MQLRFPHSLDDSLTLRVVESDADAEKVIAINAEIHGSQEGRVLRHWLFEGHPNISRGDWLFIEEGATGQAVATLSLMPVTWCYGGHPLPVAELGFVATRADYRGRGLQRVLSDAFDKMALDRAYTLAAIEGIPGFYGQFGYEYAVPLMGGFDLAYDQVPDASGKDEGKEYVLRRATVDDVPALQPLYDASISELDVSAPRDRALWTHQLAAPQVSFYAPTTVIDQADRVVGYVRWTDDDWTDRLRILELAVDEGPGARERIMVALGYTREKGRAAEKHGLKLNLPGCHAAAAVAQYLGAVDTGYYGWQMRVLDPAAFMWAIRATLEERLAGSVLAGYSGSLVFDLFRSRLALRFEAGSLAEIGRPEGELESGIRLTLKQATQLWLGWRGREALEAWYPEFWTRDKVRHLVDVLFPRARAYIYTPY